MPALNLTPADAIAVAPAGVESAAGAVGDESVAPGVPFATQNTVAEANCGAVNDVPANSGLKAGLVAEKCLGGVVDEKRIARSIDQVQTTNPKETQEVDAAKDDYPEPATAGSKKTDTPAAGRVLKTAAEQRDSTQTAEKIFLHTLGEVHEKKKEVSGEEYRQSQSVDAPEAAAAPADQAEQPSPLDAVAQLMPFVPIVTGGGAVSAAAEEIKASGLRGVGPLQKKEAVESLQPKQNDGKSASPVEDPKGTKDHKDAPDEGKRVDPHDFGATLHGAAEQGHQQAEQATIKFNMPDALPGTHAAVSAPRAAANTEHSFFGQPQQAGQMNSPEFAAPVTTPADVVHAVRMFERDGQAEMHIGVRSETFGTIDLKTTVHDGSVGVSIGVERHEVRSALVSELPGLENTLRERDLRLGEVRFHDTGSTLASDYGSGQQRQSQDFSRPPASAFYRAAKSSSGSNELPVEMVTTIARRGISVHV